MAITVKHRGVDDYMKAGVMLADFTPSGIAQPGLFDEIQPRKNSEKLMKTLDELNQSGKGKCGLRGEEPPLNGK